jgi:hypothetical protein
LQPAAQRCGAGALNRKHPHSKHPTPHAKTPTKGFDCSLQKTSQNFSGHPQKTAGNPASSTKLSRFKFMMFA